MSEIKRLIVPFIILILGVLSLSVFKIDETALGMRLFVYKGVLATSGFLLGHIVRKLAFPYVKFQSEQEWSNNAMIIAIYVMFMATFIWGG